jgi:hypothetical protein
MWLYGQRTRPQIFDSNNKVVLPTNRKLFVNATLRKENV